MACRLFGAKPLSKSMLGSEILINIQIFSLQKMHLKILSAKWQPLCPGGDELRKWPSMVASEWPWLVLWLSTQGCWGQAGITQDIKEQVVLNSLRPRQNGRRFADDTFKRIFWNENVRILIKISLKFVPKGPINNNPVLIEIMAWCRSGDKPLSQPMMVSLLTYICVTRPQWVKAFGLLVVP